MKLVSIFSGLVLMSFSICAHAGWNNHVYDSDNQAVLYAANSAYELPVPVGKSHYKNIRTNLSVKCYSGHDKEVEIHFSEYIFTNDFQYTYNIDSNNQFWINLFWDNEAPQRVLVNAPKNGQSYSLIFVDTEGMIRKMKKYSKVSFGLKDNSYYYADYTLNLVGSTKAIDTTLTACK